MRFLTVPGYTGSGDDHWQTHLERDFEGFTRVVQHDWETVDRDRWVARLDEVVRGIEEDLFLVGHSCGSVTIAQWAATHHDPRVRGALLVAPADVEAADALTAISPQAPLPRAPLPLPTHLVVSDDDPFLTPERGRELARTWGSTLEVAPGGGHLGTKDGYGRWQHAARLIEQLSGTTLEPTTGRVSLAQ